MSEICTLIKNSELAKMQEELKKNRTLRKEYVEKKTEQLRNDISIRDQRIAELEAKIKDMEENPQVDPMKMEITMMERRVIMSSRYGRDWGSGYNSDERLPYVSQKTINFNLDEGIRKQIFNIATIISKRDVKIANEEIDIRVKEEVSKQRNYWENHAFETAANMGFWELKKFLRKYKVRPSQDSE